MLLIADPLRLLIDGIDENRPTHDELTLHQQIKLVKYPISTLSLIIMPAKLACSCARQAILITAMLLFFGSLYALDASFLSIGTLKDKIGNTEKVDLVKIGCVEICDSVFGVEKGGLECCSGTGQCKGKQECRLEKLNGFQKQLSDQYLWLFGEAALLLIIIISLCAYCNRKRFQRPNNNQNPQQPLLNNNHANLFNVVGSVNIRREFNPPTLGSSFLFTDGELGCAICLQSLLQGKVKRLSCSHTFHSLCITSWVQTKDTCPICRSPC